MLGRFHLIVFALVAVLARGAGAADSNVAPADAQWTIYCQAVAGPDHVLQANAYKDALNKLKPSPHWHIIHQEDQSIIYYGWYRSINDPKDKSESDRAQNDRKALEALKDPQGNPLLTTCSFVEAASPDPEAPAEWDLRNAKGYWTVEIAMYKESPRRKQAAVDAVREARKSGIEAYFYHGPTASSVCIGAWPRNALKQQDNDVAEAPDPAQDLLVLPQPIDTKGEVEVRNKEGQRVRAVAPRAEILDPTLLATLDKYPTHAINGEVFSQKVTDPATKQQIDVPDPAVVVAIPAPAGPSLLRATGPAPTLVKPVSPSQAPGAGKLKSIGQ